MTLSTLNVDQLFRELNDIKDMIDGVHERLDTLNGRTRRLENKMYLLWWLFGAGGVSSLASFIWMLVRSARP